MNLAATLTRPDRHTPIFDAQVLDVHGADTLGALLDDSAPVAEPAPESQPPAEVPTEQPAEQPQEQPSTEDESRTVKDDEPARAEPATDDPDADPEAEQDIPGTQV